MGAIAARARVQKLACDARARRARACGGAGRRRMTAAPRGDILLVWFGVWRRGGFIPGARGRSVLVYARRVW